MLIHEPLRYWAIRTPDTPFTMSRTRRISYAEADSLADRIAVALIGQGVRTGARIGIVGRNSPEVPILILGASRAGAVPVPINPRLTPAEIGYILTDAEAGIVIAAADCAGEIEAVRSQAPVRHFLVWGEPADGWRDLRDLARNSGELPAIDQATEDDGFQLYTSGTTGRPKGVVIRHSGAAAVNLRWDLAGMRLNAGDIFHLSMPATLAAGFSQVLHTMYVGGSIWLEQFEPEAVIADLGAGGVAATALAPTMVHMLLRTRDIEDRAFASLRWILYGAAPMPVPLLREAMTRFGCDFYQGYGQSEVPAFTMLTPADHRRAAAGEEHLLGTVGRAQVGCEVRIVDLDDREVPPGVTGELCTRGPAVMSRYWKRPEETARAGANGWHHSGDLGYRDKEGFIYLVDRLNFMVVSGGYNIYPREIEQVLERVRGVAMAAVVGLPDEKWGETVVAAVVREESSDITAGDLAAACTGKIAEYKIPRSWHFLETLPMNANGKVQKTKVREFLLSRAGGESR